MRDDYMSFVRHSRLDRRVLYVILIHTAAVVIFVNEEGLYANIRDAGIFSTVRTMSAR
jgi:hypothetical protein